MCICLDAYATGIYNKSMPWKVSSPFLSLGKDTHAEHQNPIQSLELIPANLEPKAALPGCIGFLWLLA